MKPLRIYADSSAIGGCGDPEFAIDSQRLVDSARQQQLIILISETTLTELEAAPVDVQSILKDLPLECLEMVALTAEVLSLWDAYLDAGVVRRKSVNDATHVASATVSRADALVSWNFKHIVRLEKIKGYNQVNLINGYGILTIITPKEVRLHEPEE
jgi:predicted nucleic acid-binding protein